MDKAVKTPYLETCKYLDGHIVKHMRFIESNNYTNSPNNGFIFTDEDSKYYIETIKDLKMNDYYITNKLQGNDDMIYKPYLYGGLIGSNELVDPNYKNKNQIL